MKDLEIKLKERGSSFSSRAFAYEITNTLKGDQKVIFNFKDISFATPSFLHEIILNTKKKNIETEFINLNEDIKFQLKKVDKIVTRS